jgi:hypothetical protein
LSRNCLPKHLIEGKIEGKTEEKIEGEARGGRRRKELLKTLSVIFCKLKEEVLYPALRWKLALEEDMDLSQGRTNFYDVVGHHFTSCATVSLSNRNLI